MAELKEKLEEIWAKNTQVTKTKKTVAAREQGPPYICKNHCREKLRLEEEVLTKFCDLGSFVMQKSHLFSCIKVVKKKRSYPRKQKRRAF